jgi:hypothetical protein
MAPTTAVPVVVPPPSRTAAVTAQCTPQNTSVTLAMSNGAAGTLYQTLVIKNFSGAPCVTGGYPGISLDTAAGAQAGASATRQAPAGAEVLLAPGQAATDIFSYSDAGVSTSPNCHPEQATSLRVYLPGSVQSIVLPFSRMGCSGTYSYLDVWAVNVAPGS